MKVSRRDWRWTAAYIPNKQFKAECCYIIMLLRFVSRATFAKESRVINATKGLDSNLEAVLAQREKIRRDLLRQETENLPMEQSIRSYYDSIVNITLYMRHDCWQSQYLFLMLNYNKLGFRRISDLVQLDRASYLLGLREKEDSQRWPAIKVVVALEPKVVLSGVAPIDEFFRENGYFIQEVENNSGEVEALKAHIDKEVLPAMESLFWHPKLTYQYTFHTNFSSYLDTSRNYNVFGILGRNGRLVVSRIIKNLQNIALHSERYSKSKETFTKGIRELQQLYLTKAPFFGGAKPSHVDFYLMSQLRTRSGCRLFVQYLQQGIGGEFWRWWMRLSNLCQYNPDRITTL